MTCVITESGKLVFVWDDKLACLRELGPTSIKRASMVEPTGDGRWIADMAPSCGPILGPFSLREEALAAEREWLAKNRGL